MSRKFLTVATACVAMGALAIGSAVYSAGAAFAEDVPLTFGSDSDYGTPPVPPPMPEADGGATQPETTWDAGYDVEPVAGSPEELGSPDAGEPVVLEDYPAPAPGGFVYVDGEAEAAGGDVIEIAPEAGEIVEEAPVVLDADVSGWNDTAAPVVLSGGPCDAGCGPAYTPPAPVAPAVDGCTGFKGCNSCGDTRRCCPDHYITFGPEVLPGIGFGAQFGYRLTRSRNSSISAEVGFSYQDLWEEFMGEGLRGSYWAIRAGIRIDFANPCARFVPYARVGLQLWELSQVRTGATDSPLGFEDVSVDLIDFDQPGTHFGAYAAIGFDVRINKNWTTGPEFGYIWGKNVDEGGNDGTSPVFRWNFTYNF